MSDEDFQNKKKIDSNKNPLKSIFKRLLSFSIFIFVFVVVKFVTGYIGGEVRVQASKYEGWSKEFKDSFVKSCAKTAKKISFDGIMKNAPDAEVSIVGKVADVNAKTYCECITSKVEDENIIATKYNRYTGSKSYKEKLTSLINEYMSSAQGKKQIQECVKVADQKMQDYVDKLVENSNAKSREFYVNDCKDLFLSKKRTPSSTYKKNVDKVCNCIHDKFDENDINYTEMSDDEILELYKSDFAGSIMISCGKEL